MREHVEDAWTVLRRAVAEARDDRVTTTARALAYSLFLAIPAAFLVLLGLFSLFADAGTVADVVSRAGTVLPSEATTLLEQSLERATQQPRRGVVLTVLGLGLGVWTTTSAATVLMDGLTTTYGREDSRGFVRKRIVALAIVVVLALSASLVLGLLVFGPHLEHWIGSATDASGVVAWIWWTAEWPILVSGLLFAFAVVLYLGPDVEQPRWQMVTPGAVTALVVWLASSGGFALYTAWFGSYDKSWGALSAVVVTLVWLWLTSAALLLGAEVNAQVRRLAEERADAELESTRGSGLRSHAAL